MSSISPVSVIIPTLNEEKYLPILLESLARTGATVEVIVVDGNSTDRTREVATEFATRFSGESSLRVILCEKRGVAAQRNFGGRSASRDILLFLDADTAVSSATYARLVDTFVQKRYVVAAPYVRSIESDWRADLIYMQGLPLQWSMLLFGRAYFPGTCTMVRRNTFLEVGGYDETLAISEDIDFSIRAGKTGRHGFIMAFIKVSSRRFRKYGYAHVYFQWVRGVLSSMFFRERMLKNITYKFGEFAE